MSEPERPRKRIGILNIVKLLLIAVVLVIAGSLLLVIGICSGIGRGSN